MRQLHSVSLGIALAAGFAFVGTGACSTSDGPGTPTATGGAASKGGSESGGGTGGEAASGGAPSGGGVTSGGASGSGGAGGRDGSAGGAAGTTGGSDSGSVKSMCVPATKNTTVGNSCPGTAPPALKLTQIATGFAAPTFVTPAPGDPERLYVVEQQSGLVRTVKDGVIEATPFLNIKSILGGGGLSSEQGFLGLTFDPNYETSRRFFIKYSGKTGNGRHVVAEYKVGSNGVADPDSARIIVEFDHLDSVGNHNGGMVAFGPDGCLYVAVGDGGGTGPDPHGKGQDPSDLFGNILRLDVDRFPAPAPGNLPAPANPHVWSYGLRNPWRFSFDGANGDLYIGDVGEGGWEEVDVEPRGTVGRNYGWPIMEGAHCYHGETCDLSSLTLPAADYENPRDGDVYHGVIGGYVYRGTKIPGMMGRYVYTDMTTKKILSFVYKGETDGKPDICDAAELTGVGESASGNIVSFGQDLAGEVYFVTQVNGGPGSLYRIDPAD
jgi:glucose/arabinose dehydrogenase